jgi:FSR family fosmidomycin resistance protein-like MFS transporter
MSRGPRRVLLVLVGAHVVNDFYSTILPAFLPAVADEFDLDYTELGILSFAFILFTGVLQPVLGNTADRRGRRRWMLVVGFVVGAVGFVAMAAAPTFWFIVSVSLLCGLGGATYHPQAAAFIVSAYPLRRGRMLGIHGWGGSAGHFLAPAVAVLSISMFNWRLAMAAIAVPMVFTAVILRVRLDETPASPSARLRGVVTRPLVLLAVTFGIVSMVGRSFLTFFVKMLVDDGWEETSAGVLLTIVLLVGVVAQPLGGWAFDRVGGRRVFRVATVASAVLIAVFAVSSGVTSLIAITGIAFFQFSLFPVALAQASRFVAPTQTGAAIGVVFGVSGLMTAAAQPAVGALAEVFGDIRIALAWQLPLALVGVALTRFIPEKGADLGKGHTDAEALAGTSR